ncbi:hypothetical protein GH714_006425 [Hevea brasiliensis]|uniref:Protein NO VEIN C-terminal domain-containing protein n=1 Tax=Hevea brasiliensis TaxID=3981 RepID=A0A6A6LEU1_HEVBR|nr:hypothetical protein GH714_006425 [Hevea brasiliensis]
MNGHRPHFRQGGGGGGRGRGQPSPSLPLQSPPLNMDPNLALQNIYLQSMANAMLHGFAPQQNYFPVHQNPNFPIQNPYFPIQNTNIPPPQQISNGLAQQQQQQPPQNSAQKGGQNLPSPQNAEQLKQKGQKHERGEREVEKAQHDLAQQQQQQHPHNSAQQQVQFMPRQNTKKHKRKELLERVDRAAEKAWQDLLAAGESVSAWKVSQAALVTLQVDSWDSLGFRMQEVPSLHRLILTEGKVNAFIHCFVGVRRITSLYDLEVAICENEGIEEFEELELGPLLRHPLVLHYFSVNSDATEVLKITTEDIILSLHEYMSTFSKKEINIDEFLDFIAKKQSVKGKGNLGVRIQGLGMHISFIREAKRSKNSTLKKCLKTLKRKSEAKTSRNGSGNKCRKRPLLSTQKKDLDERFSAMSQRVESFASAHKDFRGKHIRFDSSCSEDEESDDSTNDDKMNSSDEGRPFSLQNVNSTDRVSSCPYPSATEEMSRLGLKGEMGGQSSPLSSSLRHKRYGGSRRKKRKLEDVSCTASAPSKLCKQETGKHNTHKIENDNDAEEVTIVNEDDISISDNSMRMFITTWKEACKEHTVAEVTSMKCGMLDSIYDTFQAFTQHESPNTLSEYESIDVEPGEKQKPVVPDHSLQQTRGVTVEEVLGKINEYYEFDHKFVSNRKFLPEDKFISVKKVCSCEFWLVDQFCIKEFKSLGYGEFFIFLEKHASLLPTELQKLLAGDTCEKSPVEVSLLQHQLMVLVSQASNSLCEGESISKKMISALLVKQFPMLSFKIMENGSIEDFLHIVGENKNNVISKCVVFSATLLENHHIGDPLKEDDIVESTGIRTNNGQNDSATSKNAIEVLLRAPLLSDLNSWSHWDLIFAPSLGPLVGWLLNEVSAKELLCLVTKDGKVIRIDQSANVDSFLEAALQRSSFQTAVKLLSLLSLAGGEKHVPLSLLKCYARHAFDVILKNHFENKAVQDNNNYLLLGKIVDEGANNLSGELHKNSIQMNQVVPVASRFVLDSLAYLPSEFRGFAAGVLLSGMQSVIKDAPSAILFECNQEERVMLHEIGLSIGIVEWIDDYHAFCLTGTTDLFTSSEPAHLEAAGSAVSTGLRYTQNVLDRSSCGDGETIVHQEDVHNEAVTETSLTIQDIVSSNEIGIGCAEESSELDKQKDAALVIESIRRDEFGLDPNLSCMESTMLRKQHARLGRALHCLSQELYSEDSHFLLELVQNADDNIYPECVEPTLTFILQESGSGTGYIGQKGIGFKSVFRVTDAPEIHSNGFHIKFDVSEGQIGFVLPTVVPPCNVDLFSRLVFGETEVLQDGIIKVSCGKDKMTWLVASQKLQACAGRPKVQTTEIAIAFTLEESDNGDYHPRLDQQPVFSFLPLRTYGLKFILQGDFVLPSSREEVDKNDPWNEWLLTKFPGLFVNAERSFCALSCFRENPGKAVTAYMSFVPLVGEVHGFFSALPKAIALELQRTSCLLLEGDNCKMVPPCNVLRGWNEQARILLPDGLLQEHLGLGFLDKNIVLSDSLAKALGIAEYGPEILIKFIACLCHTENGLKTMGFGWLSSFLSAVYIMFSHSSGSTDLIDKLQRIPFIPLSDGTYSSVDRGTIWLHSDILSTGFDGAQELVAFPQLYVKLQTVNPALFSASAVDGTLVDNSARMLQKIGVQQLSAHEIVKVHILPSISDYRITNSDEGLMTDYLCFVMIHLQSNCSHCCVERKYIISELQNKAYILTNLGYRRPVETSIHFSKEYGNPININKLVNVVDMKWHEVDITYLKHPGNDSLFNGLMKWRGFFQEIGVTDFVRVEPIEKGISDLYHTVSKNITWDTELISPGSVVKDWESYELVQILSHLSMSGDRERCKYLLEVLDTLWDDNFSDKATGYCFSKSSVDGRTFKSSFLGSIHDVQWVVSSIDDELHYPKDLFYDSDVVHSILGGSAPYALPKVRSTKLLGDIGFKTKVTLDDALEVLRIWRESETPFKASITQMSKLYTFIWDEMAASKKKVLEALLSVSFIFVPYESGSRHEDLVSGVFLSSEEVYWHDPTGLHDFFVKECGVHEIPSCRSYFDILRQLSTVALPSQAASTVFQVFLKWTDGLKSDLLSSEDIIYMKECLLKVEYTILPTIQDKWVSLHPSFGLVCWCDDKNLKKIFKDLDNIDFLYFGNLSDYEEEMLQTKVSDLMHNLGIPALSEIITREAIYYGPSDCSFKAALVDWALPYAQRYIYSVHPDKYLQFKLSGLDNLEQLKITVVEKLFYRNVIKSCGSASKKRYECSCLLQGNTLYTTSESDSHVLFLELSRLFFEGTSDLHLANFLHMITTMVESGSTEDQTEFFIVNSQKVPKLPDDESAWSLSSICTLTENDESLKIGFGYARANGFKTQAVVSHPSSSCKTEEDDSEDIIIQTDTSVPIEIDTDWTIEENTAGSILPDSESVDKHSAHACNQTVNLDFASDPVGLTLIADVPELRREKLNTGTANAAQLLLTGRLGERVAFKFN